MTSVYVSRNAPRALVTNRWLRNGKYPTSQFQGDLANEANHAARWLTKEAFCWACPTDAIPAALTMGGASAGRDRWRFAWHTGPYAKYLRARIVAGAAANDTDITEAPAVRVTIVNGAGSTIGTIDWSPGFSGATPLDNPAYFRYGSEYLKSSGALASLPADTDLFGLVEDRGVARAMSISIYEESLPSDTSNGYVQDAAAGQPILDTDRSGVATILRNMWKRGGAQLFNWTVDQQASPRTIATTADTNCLDTSITTVSAASPGFVLDFDNKTRVAGTGVPCVMKVYAARGTSDGNVYLKKADGTTLVTVTVTSTAAWYSSGVVYIPSSATGKCDLMFDSGGGTLSLYAVSMWRYET